MNYRKQFAIIAGILAIVLLLGMGSMTTVSAQATATFTPTTAATNTPTPTATPLATALPLVINASGQYIGQRVGIYGMPTPSTDGSAFQSAVGSIDLYNLSTGRHTVNIDNATGNITTYGAIVSTTGTNWKCQNTNVTGTVTATPIAGATPVGNPVASIGSITGDAARPFASYSTGVFTIGVMNSALTPAPNTTPAAVEWCYHYTTAP